MAEIEEISSKHEKLDQLRAESSKQGAYVRQLKADGAAQELITEAVEKLKVMKIEVEKEEKKHKEPEFDREGFDSILLRRMIVVPSFEIYGGEKGLFDFGTEGSFLLDNIVAIWRKHFVIKENMLQLTGSCLTPEPVFKSSGHVDRFQDLMCKDLQTGSCYRADKLLEDHIERLLETPEVLGNKELREEYERIFRQADAYSEDELHYLISSKFNIRSPESGSELSKPFPFNLMFLTHIGPEGTKRGYLRPETAQGIFVNFKRLLERKGGKLPFACAQVGLGFRNEISPRSGLIRVREFLMGEIEHFVDADDKSHPKFDQVRDVRVTLFPRENQVGNGRLISATIGAAVDQGIIANQTLGYFIARTYLFLQRIGIDPTKLRFRQHLLTEMAHYAMDCWDGEIKLSYGWIECVGLADRSCYDLKVHSEATKTDLIASRQLDSPKTIPLAKATINKAAIGKIFKKEAAPLLSYIDEIQELDVEKAMSIEKELAEKGSSTIEVDGKSFDVKRDMLSFEKSEKTIHQETFYPHVIEPSFGLGRIFYSVLEHCYYAREEENDDDSKIKRAVLGLKAEVAPIKVAVFPLMNKPEYTSFVERLQEKLVDEIEVSVDTDVSSVSIGKRYARMDEIGVPFALTVDGETLEGAGATLRERDSTQQVRIPEAELSRVLQGLVRAKSTWQDVVTKYGLLK